MMEAGDLASNPLSDETINQSARGKKVPAKLYIYCHKLTDHIGQIWDSSAGNDNSCNF